jgi:hypothetical protein
VKEGIRRIGGGYILSSADFAGRMGQGESQRVEDTEVTLVTLAPNVVCVCLWKETETIWCPSLALTEPA